MDGKADSLGSACAATLSCDPFAIGSCELKLFFLLFGLNNPPITPELPDSPDTPLLPESLDFLRLRANPALNLSAGDGLALRLRLAVVFVTGEDVVGGSTIKGSEDVESFTEGPEACLSDVDPIVCGWLCAWSCGEDKVKYPRWDW